MTKSGMYGDDELEHTSEGSNTSTHNGQADENPATTLEIEQEKEEEDTEN